MSTVAVSGGNHDDLWNKGIDKWNRTFGENWKKAVASNIQNIRSRENPNLRFKDIFQKQLNEQNVSMGFKTDYRHYLITPREQSSRHFPEAGDRMNIRHVPTPLSKKQFMPTRAESELRTAANNTINIDNEKKRIKNLFSPKNITNIDLNKEEGKVDNTWLPLIKTVPSLYHYSQPYVGMSLDHTTINQDVQRNALLQLNNLYHLNSLYRQPVLYYDNVGLGGHGKSVPLTLYSTFSSQPIFDMVY
ncbi:hypothetical protein [Bacillus chungangensis]|uniref:Uncharacterized protein n=1 Tax=Bacillus chungangensis TaxID=587633 RepID=A0ABT9WWV2_9BACI|nr:hypothetical protein [Bacillus chungangensis]MDQ0177774.1 hypothetical protein [Bacillus chungangensis]